MASLSLPVRPVSTKPFRFTGPPGVIRDKIYKIVFTVPWFEEEQWNESDPRGVPADPPKLDCYIETQISRACLSINTEADYILWKTNFFVKFTANVM